MRRPRGEFTVVIIVGIEDNPAGGAPPFQQAQQPAFRFEILRHGPVIIEMLAAQVSKGRTVKKAMRHPLLHQSVRRDFHHRHRRPFLQGKMEIFLEIQRLWGGQAKLLSLILQNEAVTAHYGGAVTGCFEDAGDKIGGRGLSISAGYPHRLHPIAGVSVKVGCGGG